MNCPSCDLPFLYPAATKCPRCGYGLGENGPINLLRDEHGKAWSSIRQAIVVVLFALLLLGIYGYFTDWK